MPTIFGKDASAEDFQLLMQSLYALSMPGARGGDFAHMIKPVGEAQTISEETFIELAADGDIAAKALQSDPRSAKYLPGGAPLLELPSTWMAILGDKKTRYWDPPAFPATLIADAKLINEIVSRKPRILASYADDAQALSRIIPQLSPENLARFVAEFPAAYELLPDGTKTEAFALKVVQADPRGRLTAPLVRRYGAKLAIAAFDADPMSLLEIPDEVAESKEVREYVLQRIRDSKDAECPCWAVAYFEKHPGTALEFIRTKPEWLEDYSFVTIPGVHEALARQFAEVITTPKQMEMFLAAAYAGARDDVPSPIGFITSYDGEITDGISAWRRIHPEMFMKGAGGDPGEGGGKKVLVIASPKDWNGAFMTVPLIDRFDSLGAGRIDYREVGSEAELRALIAELKEGGIVYDEILIAGHGTSDTIALGGQDRRVGGDEKLDDDLYIDFSDFSDASLDISPLLATDGSLYLFSCSNGEGAEEKDNIANRYAGMLHKGQRAVSSQVPTNIMYMDLDEQGRTDPYWVGMRPYITAGRKEG